MNRVVTLAALLVLGSAARAQADVILIDSTTLALGTDVSHMFDGITLQRLTQPSVATYAPIASSVVTMNALDGPSFGGSFWDLGSGYDACYGGGTMTCMWNPFSVLELTFDAPTSYVQIAGDWRSDHPGLRAYDINGNRLSICGDEAGASPDCVTDHSAGGDSNRTVLTIDRGQRDIARVVWGGLYGTGFAKEISYDVPEPSTWLLVTLGAACFGRYRRRRPS